MLGKYGLYGEISLANVLDMQVCQKAKVHWNNTKLQVQSQWACFVVFSDQIDNVQWWTFTSQEPNSGTKIRFTLWILRVGGRGSFTSKSFIFFLLFSFLDVFSKFLMSFVKFVKLFSVFKERSLFLSVFNYTLQDYDTRRKRWGVVLVEGGGFEAHC